MNNSVLWEDQPSMVLLASDTIKVILAGMLAFFVIFVAKTNYLEQFMQSHFALSFVGDFIKFGGSYLVNIIIVSYVFFILVFASKIIRICYEQYKLDEECFHFRNGVFTEVQDETQLFRMIDFEVEKPFLLRLFGLGNLVIFSNDPSLESGLFTKSFITPDGNKGMKLAGIKDPEGTKQLFKQQVAKARNQRGMRATELI